MDIDRQRVEAFAEALRTARSAILPKPKLSAVGRAIGRSASSMSRWEKGLLTKVPPEGDIIALEQVLEIDDSSLAIAAGYQRRVVDTVGVTDVVTAVKTPTADRTGKEAIRNIVEILRRSADEIELTIQEIGDREN